jgi:hypothetical protein
MQRGGSGVAPGPLRLPNGRDYMPRKSANAVIKYAQLMHRVQARPLTGSRFAAWVMCPCPDAILMASLLAERTFAQVQARALNAHDLDFIAYNTHRNARILRDGRLVGEGRDDLRAQLEAELKDLPTAFARLVDTNRGPMVAEYETADGGPVWGMIRFESTEGLCSQVDIEHRDDGGIVAIVR